ncbi:hypothetical protein IWQ56_002194 [Coemansia nantahalensis]|nr:hypothetical protein IWQ56_002194 [Coemansia nantahalensis]
MSRAVDGNLSGRVSIELMEGSDPSNLGSVATIVENVAAAGQQAFWTVPRNLKSSKNYAIKIVHESGEDYYGQFFRGTGVRASVPPMALSAERTEMPKQRTAVEPTGASVLPKVSTPQSRTSGTMAMRREGASASGAAGPAGVAAAAVAVCIAAAL